MNRSVWFPGDLAERVQARAHELDRSFNWVVVRELEKALGSAGTSGSEDRMPPSPAQGSAPPPTPAAVAQKAERPASTRKAEGSMPSSRSRTEAFRGASQRKSKS